VEARNRGEKQYSPAVVTEVSDDGATYSLVYDDGRADDDVERKWIEAMNKAPKSSSAETALNNHDNRQSVQSDSKKIEDSTDLKVQSDGRFTPNAMAKIKDIFNFFDQDKDGMWDIVEWSMVQKAIGGEESASQAQMEQLTQLPGVSLQNERFPFGKCG